MGLLLALVEASGFNPSLIILDVNLPDMLGFDVASDFVRAHKPGKYQSFTFSNIRSHPANLNRLKVAPTGLSSTQTIYSNL